MSDQKSALPQVRRLSWPYEERARERLRAAKMNAIRARVCRVIEAISGGFYRVNYADQNLRFKCVSNAFHET
jgi:hypothetical protein